MVVPETSTGRSSAMEERPGSVKQAVRLSATAQQKDHEHDDEDENDRSDADIHEHASVLRFCLPPGTAAAVCRTSLYPHK
jgi:hypothetical protein